MADAKDIEALSFEQAMKELEDIVRRLEAGGTDLETAIRDYTRGTALTQHCQKKLEGARLKVEAIVKAQDGTVSTKPFETEKIA